MPEIAVYFEDKKLLPPVQEVLSGVIAQYPQITDVEQWNELTDRTMPVLVLGRLPEVLPISYVKTLSQKQILSNPAATTELQAALDLLLTPPTWEEVPYAVVDELTDEEEKALGPVLVVDIETGGTADAQSDLPEDWWLLSLAIYDGKKCYVYTEESLAEDTLDNARAQVLRLLKSRKLIAHNMKFDFRTLGKHLGEKTYGHLDTMLLHHAINPGAKEHGLKELARKYLGAPDWDAAIKDHLKNKKIGYEQIPRELLYHYNAGDVVWTWRLYEYFAKAGMGDERITKLAKREFAMGNFYQDVENQGATVDVPYLEELDAQFEGEIKPLLEELQDRAWEKFNPGSHVQVKKWFAEHGYPLKSTDEKHLDDLAAKDDLSPKVREFIDTLLEYRGVSKLRNTYTQGIKKRLHYGNRVFPTLLVHGTNTGRLSSKNPNIQNIPRDKRLRKLFISRDEEERCILNVDYSQAELRVMACLSEDEYLISLFQPDAGDFFDNLMPAAFPNEDIASWDSQTKKDKRANLKGVIYGMSYGRRAPAIAKALDMPVGEAQGIMDNYFRNATALYDWRQWVEQMAIDPERTLISPYGRYYQAEVVTGRNRQNVINSGLAFLPQSTASDLCVDAAMETHKWIGQYDAWVFATVHDAIMLDVPKKYVEEIAARVKAEMERSALQVFGPRVPFAAEASWGRSWGDCD